METKTISRSQSRWLGSWYAYWERKTGGNKYGYRENLCHFFWTIVLRVPFTFVKSNTWDPFWKQKIAKTAFRPWSILLFGFLTAYLVKMPRVLWLKLLSEIGTALLAVLILVVGAVIVAVVWNFLLRPILDFLWSRLTRLNAVQWFINAPILWQIRPWMIAVLLLQLVSYYMSSGLELDNSAWYLVYMIIYVCEIFALVIGALFVILAGVVMATEAYSYSDIPDGISSTKEVVVEWFNTTKRPICPYIDIVD